MTQTVRNKWLNKLLTTVLAIVLLAGALNLTAPATAFAEPSNSLEITGDGVTTPVTLTLAQLEAMEQYQHVYSAINTWPTKKWYTGKGVKLRDLLALAGMTDAARLIKFTSNDGYDITLTVKELLKDKRYYFPGLKDNHASDGSIPGSPEGAEEVEPILALLSAEGSDNPDEMNDRDSLLLLLGQRAVSEQTNPLFLKYTNRIEVLTTAPEKWDNPRANIDSGAVVPAGTMVKLSNKSNNEDKIYFTTDGSTPTVNSPMFNWSASRWWPLRPDDLDNVNRPVEIKEDTVIKAVTIGPGKEDSDVVTFTFTADLTGRTADPTKIPGGPPTGVMLDRNTIDLKVGGTFQLAATVAPYNATDRSVTWSSSDTRVATVDNNGLVTVVGPGSAAITVKTVDGNLSAICIVNGPDQEAGVQTAAPAGPASQTNGEPDQQYLAEMETAAALSPPAAGTQEPEAGQDPAEKETAATGSTATDPPWETTTPEQQVPEANRQYLAEKKDVAAVAASAGASSEQSGGQNRQVFEVSADAVPLEPQRKQNSPDIFAAAAFLILFFWGAGRRYAEHVKEI